MVLRPARSHGHRCPSTADRAMLSHVDKARRGKALTTIAGAIRLAMYAGAIAATAAAIYLTIQYLQRVVQAEGW